MKRFALIAALLAAGCHTTPRHATAGELVRAASSTNQPPAWFSPAEVEAVRRLRD
jgi:hypothetical protein